MTEEQIEEAVKQFRSDIADGIAPIGIFPIDCYRHYDGCYVAYFLLNFDNFKIVSFECKPEYECPIITETPQIPIKMAKAILNFSEGFSKAVNWGPDDIFLKMREI